MLEVTRFIEERRNAVQEDNSVSCGLINLSVEEE